MAKIRQYLRGQPGVWLLSGCVCGSPRRSGTARWVEPALLKERGRLANTFLCAEHDF